MRRDAKSRRTLVRECGTCGKRFVTTADTPWVRQIPREGKRQATTYFCSSGCFQASYKHIGWYDGKSEERRRAKDSKRDVKEKNKRYYSSHAERLKERAKERYWADPKRAQASMKYYRQKRKLLEAELL